jgi:thiol-disulfide isomerase/thioredoxin
MLIINIKSFSEFNEILDKYDNIIVNISANWCKPCMTIKPLLEKYINVINENDFIYLKIDHSIYEQDDEFDIFFGMKKIPFFIFIKNKKKVDSIISGDFSFVSKKIFDYIKKIKGDIKINNDTNDNFTFEKNDDF